MPYSVDCENGVAIHTEQKKMARGKRLWVVSCLHSLLPQKLINFLQLLAGQALKKRETLTTAFLYGTLS